MKGPMHFVAQISLVTLFTLTALASSASAQMIPAELKPYAVSYQTAVKSKDRIAIAERAYDLWQASEDTYGDSALTGDLAHLYAKRSTLLPISEKNSRKTRKAFRRSVSLAVLSPEPFETNISRRLDMIEGLSRGHFSKPSWKEIRQLRDTLNDWTDIPTIYHADINAIVAHYTVFQKGDTEDALAPAIKAKTIYEGLGQTGSKRALDNYEILIRAMHATGADLIAQSLMVQEYAQAAVNGSKSKRQKIEAITLYRKAHRLVENEGQMAAAEAAGFWKPDVVTLMEAGELDLLKVHPIMPPRATESGYADVQFSVRPDGSVTDVEVLSQSDDIFGVAAMESVSQWWYHPNRVDIDGKPIVERIEFDLYGTYGERR
ncbi:MAG: energy transducer TonB [Litorimonas sp.]